MNIIVGVDGREQQVDAIALSRVLADVWGGGVIVVHVYPGNWLTSPLEAPYQAAMRRDATAIVEAAGVALGRPFRTCVVGDSSTAWGLHRVAEQEHADVIVLGSAHRGRIGRAIAADRGERVIHGAPCAIAIAPRGYADRQAPPKRVGVAYDGGPEAHAALEWAQAFAHRAGAQLTLYRVLERPYLAIYPALPPLDAVIAESTKRDAAELEHAVAALPPALHARGVVLDGRANNVLAEAAGQEDLLVTGSRGYGAVGTVLLGSVSHSLVHHSTTPLVILPRQAAASSRDVAAVPDEACEPARTPA